MRTLETKIGAVARGRDGTSAGVLRGIRVCIRVACGRASSSAIGGIAQTSVDIIIADCDIIIKHGIVVSSIVCIAADCMSCEVIYICIIIAGGSTSSVGHSGIEYSGGGSTVLNAIVTTADTVGGILVGRGKPMGHKIRESRVGLLVAESLDRFFVCGRVVIDAAVGGNILGR